MVIKKNSALVAKIKMGGVIMYRYGEDARKTPEWEEAEQRYSQYHTHDVFSIMGNNPHHWDYTWRVGP